MRVELFTTKRLRNTDPSLPFRLAWQIRRRKIDILHTHSWGTLVEGIAAAKMARTPLIFHGEHGIMEERSRNIKVQRYLWSKADQLTAVADSLADRMARLVGVARGTIRVIPNGVDTVRFRPLPAEQGRCRRQFQLPDSGVLLGMVARLVSVKNHLGVLHAMAELRRRGIDVQLALAGDGPLRAELQQAATELGIADRVHFLGNILEVEQFLAALDLFVLNSDSEGMSNTILEAMSCELPVVATSVGSNPVLVVDGQSGCLVPVGDIARLVQVLERLTRAPDLRRDMGNAGRKRIEQDFSIDRMVQDYQDLYWTKAGSLPIPQSDSSVAKRRPASTMRALEELN